MIFSDNLVFKINRIKRKIVLLSEKKVSKKIQNYKTKYPEVMSIEDTISLLKKGYSFSRFGDGEFNLCYNQSIYFQKSNEKLRIILRSILFIGRNDNLKFLVGIPRLKYAGVTFWGRFWYFHLNQIVDLLNVNVVYGDLGLSRHIEKKHLPILCEIWNNRKVLFVYGKNSKFNHNHEIFENIGLKYHLETLKSDAFKELNEILTSIDNYKDKVDLVILSLGPTASILAYEICERLNIQSIDLGHITNVIDAKYKGQKFVDR